MQFIREKNKNITIIITSFERYDRLKNLLDSIDRFYPDIKIIVVENSKESIIINRKNVTTYILPFDSGLSACRNYAVERVSTKYFLLLDDDFVFTKDTKIEILEDILENSDLDIIGANVKCVYEKLVFNGLLEMDSEMVLHYKKEYHKRYKDYTTYDIIFNFFLAKTDIIKKHKWDKRLKLAEHVPYFLEHKGKLRIGYTNKVSIWHDFGGYSKDDNKYRNRNNEFFEDFLEREGIKGIINFQGKYIKSPR